LGREKQQYTAALGQLEGDRDRLEQENQRHALALQECDEQLAGLRQQTLLQAGQLGRTESEIRSLRQQSERLQAELRLVKQSRTWRLRQMVVTRLRRSA